MEWRPLSHLLCTYFFPLRNSINSLCTVCKQNVYANTFKRACWPYKTYSWNTLIWVFFSNWFTSFPQTNSINIYIPSGRSRVLSPDFEFPLFEEAHSLLASLPSFELFSSVHFFLVPCMYSHLFIHLHLSSKLSSFPTAYKPYFHPFWLKPKSRIPSNAWKFMPRYSLLRTGGSPKILLQGKTSINSQASAEMLI